MFSRKFIKPFLKITGFGGGYRPSLEPLFGVNYDK